MEKKNNLNNSDINIIDILKRKINRKVNEHVKHKASLRAFDNYIKNLGNLSLFIEKIKVSLEFLIKVFDLVH